jgi:hypothetical protein
MRPGQRIADLAAARPGHAATWFGVLACVAVAGVATGDRRVWAYLTVCLVLLAVVATADAVAQFSDGLLSLLLVVGVLHLAGGLVPHPSGAGRVLYDLWLLPGVLRFDQVVHVLGSIAGTWASWQLLGRYLELGRTPPRVQALVACLGGMGKGAINEVFEFVTAINVPGTHVGGYQNTGWDLVFDLAGCVAAGVYLVQSRAARATAPRAVRRTPPVASGILPGGS